MGFITKNLRLLGVGGFRLMKTQNKGSFIDVGVYHAYEDDIGGAVAFIRFGVVEFNHFYRCCILCAVVFRYDTIRALVSFKAVRRGFICRGESERMSAQCRQSNL